jgi:predicted nucleotidyltransferase
MASGTFGLTPAQWSIVDTLIIKPLTERGATLFVFGSRARGDHQPFSDLDILVEGDIGSSLLSSIAEEIEESNLPIRVDIVLARDLASTYGASVGRDKVKVS